MKKILLPGLAAGVAMLVVWLVLSQVLAFLFPQLAVEFANPALFRPWSDPLMVLFFAYPFVLGVVLAWMWNKTKGVWKNGVDFALAYWLSASIPGMFVSYTSFPLSLVMVLSWTITGLAEVLCASAVFERMNKK